MIDKVAIESIHSKNKEKNLDRSKTHTVLYRSN